MLAVFSLQSNDLTAGTTDVRIDIKCLPQVIDRSGSRHGSDVNKDANVGLEDGTESVEEPTMRVDLFLVLFLQAEQDLYGNMATFGPLDIEVGRIDGHWGTRIQFYGNRRKTKKDIPWVVYS